MADAYSETMAVGAERRRTEMNARLEEHVASYPINLASPANVVGSAAGGGSADPGEVPMTGSGRTDGAVPDEPKPRTSDDFVNQRLLESGVLFDDLQSLGEASEAISSFIQGMKGSGCYDSVRVVIGKPVPQRTEEQAPPNGSGGPAVEARGLDVILEEKKWYKLYAGGGIKHEGLVGASGMSNEMLPRVQLETSGGLLNLTGFADVTSASHTVDQTGATTLAFSHDRPLFSCFAQGSPLYGAVLTSPLLNGSRTSLRMTGAMNTVDWECARSSRDRIRSVGVRIGSAGHVQAPEAAEGQFASLEWSAAFRDVLPRRHRSVPFQCDASPEIVAQSGPSWKNSVTYQHRLNGSLCDDRYNPTAGVDANLSLEVAGPPGDVGFVRGTGGAALHVPVAPIMGGLSFHASLNGGFIKSITYGGLCPATTSVSDRFYVGGPMQLRGFMHSGIGPRAETVRSG